jgi:hypothetical protein
MCCPLSALFDFGLFVGSYAAHHVWCIHEDLHDEADVCIKKESATLSKTVEAKKKQIGRDKECKKS